MENQNFHIPLSSIRVFYLFIQVIWVVSVIGIGFWSVVLPIGFFGTPDKKPLFDLVTWATCFRGMFSGAIFLWVLYPLRSLTCTVNGGRPFDITNPSRIRKIAFGVFAWIPVGIIGEYLLKPARGPITWVDFAGVLWQKAVVLGFLGLAILMIAEVFDVGVRLKQDQDLTV
jgi:hypothetical protein